jgi:predicted amidohydrolase
MRVTLAQLSPHPRDVAANLDRLVGLVGDHRTSELLVVPELYLSGYQLSEVEPLAVELDGPEVDRLRNVAGDADLALIAGVAEKTAGGIANSALCIDRSGELAGVYRKTHLFGAENDVYTPGDRLSVVSLCGRRVGVMICFDLEFPEVARTLAARGADMMVTVSANSPPFEADHDLFARARALESGLPHVYVNRVGVEDGLSFCGGSLAVDPDARVLAEAGPEGEWVLAAGIGPPLRRDPRTRYLEQLRADLYATSAESVREEL